MGTNSDNIKWEKTGKRAVSIDWIVYIPPKKGKEKYGNRI